MWDKILDYTQRLININARVDKSDERTAALKQEVSEMKTEIVMLTEAIRIIRGEQLQDRQNAAYERENLLLRLEVALLKQGRGELTPAPPTGGAS